MSGRDRGICCNPLNAAVDGGTGCQLKLVWAEEPVIIQCNNINPPTVVHREVSNLRYFDVDNSGDPATSADIEDPMIVAGVTTGDLIMALSQLAQKVQQQRHDQDLNVAPNPPCCH